MKLDPDHLPRVGKDTAPVGGTARRGPVRETPRQDASSSAAKQTSDGLVLSAQGDRFRQLRARLASLPEPAQPERVASLKALVASGNFKVDGQQVAGALLSDQATAAALGIGPSG